MGGLNLAVPFLCPVNLCAAASAVLCGSDCDDITLNVPQVEPHCLVLSLLVYTSTLPGVHLTHLSVLSN